MRGGLRGHSMDGGPVDSMPLMAEWPAEPGPQAPGPAPSPWIYHLSCPVPAFFLYGVLSPQMGAKVLRAGQVLGSESVDKHLLPEPVRDPPPRAVGPRLVRFRSTPEPR